MQQSIFYPSKELAPFISHYVSLASKETPSRLLSYQDFPRTAMDMVFTFDGSIQIKRTAKTTFSLHKYEFIGLFNSAYHVQVENSISALHIRFKPNGVYPLTKVPLHYILNSHLSLTELMGNSIDDLYQQMGALSNQSEKINLLESWLRPFYQRDRLHYRMEYGIQLIEQQKGLISVKTLSEQLNTNYKSLDRWFQKMVGVSPKAYIQMSRFKNILSQLDQQKEADWIQLTVDHGFYDQAHFIKSFKQFAGITPAVYQSRNLPQ